MNDYKRALINIRAEFGRKNMDNKNFLKNIYDDFFGIEKLKNENRKLAEELGLNKEYPSIELNKDNIVGTEKAKRNIAEENEVNTGCTIGNNGNMKPTKEIKDTLMVQVFEKIEKMYLTEEAKSMLKKIIEYMRKYNEKIEKQYIPFNICIDSDNKEIVYEIIDIISDVATCFEYVKQGDTVEVSFYNLEKVEQIDRKSVV